MEKKRNISYPEGNGRRDSTWWPPSLTLIPDTWGIYMIKNLECGWLIWQLKLRRVIPATQITGTRDVF
jgi:hypothetical protein